MRKITNQDNSLQSNNGLYIGILIYYIYYTAVEIEETW